MIILQNFPVFLTAICVRFLSSVFPLHVSIENIHLDKRFSTLVANMGSYPSMRHHMVMQAPRRDKSFAALSTKMVFLRFMNFQMQPQGVASGKGFAALKTPVRPLACVHS
jgi:hypothetical protein